MFCCSCLVFLLWILPVPKLAHLWNSQPCKSCQMYWMVVLALCTICHQGGTQRTSSSASSCHHGFTTVSRQCHCIFPLGWTTPASHPLHWELSSQPSWLKSHPIPSIFPSFLFTLPWPCCWQQWLYRLVAAVWLSYFVPVLFHVVRSCEPTLDPRLACQPLYICRYSW